MTNAQKDRLDRVVSGEVTSTEAMELGFNVALVPRASEGWGVDDYDDVVPSLAETVAWFSAGFGQ